MLKVRAKLHLLDTLNDGDLAETPHALPSGPSEDSEPPKSDEEPAFHNGYFD